MSKELSTKVDEETLALLKESFPAEMSYQRIMLPRLALVSQDKTEGKGKSMKVVAEAGTFYTEKQTDELDENDKKIWKKEELGTSIEGIILFTRKQLRYYDGEKYTSSPVYDSDDEVVPLFRDKTEIDRGTVKELRARDEYQGVTQKGKPTSKLEENKILYVLYIDTVYQMNLRGTSMYAFQTYARKLLVPSVLTAFGSEPKENGSTSWSQMTFKASRPLNKKEVLDVIERVNEIKLAIVAEKGQYVATQPQSEAARISAKEAKEF